MEITCVLLTPFPAGNGVQFVAVPTAVDRLHIRHAFPQCNALLLRRHFDGANSRILYRADWCKVVHLSVFIFVLSVLFCCNYAQCINGNAIMSVDYLNTLDSEREALRRYNNKEKVTALRLTADECSQTHRPAVYLSLEDGP